MKLPNLDRITIPEAKLTEYLLSMEHPRRRPKASFFRRFGFPPGMWSVFVSALIIYANLHDVTNVKASPFGTRYTVDGFIETPDRRNPFVRVV